MKWLFSLQWWHLWCTKTFRSQCKQVKLIKVSVSLLIGCFELFGNYKRSSLPCVQQKFKTHLPIVFFFKINSWFHTSLGTLVNLIRLNRYSVIKALWCFLILCLQSAMQPAKMRWRIDISYQLHVYHWLYKEINIYSFVYFLMKSLMFHA